MTGFDDSIDPAPPTPEAVWQARVVCSVHDLQDPVHPATPTRVKEVVGAKFATYFSASARLYEGPRPSWEKRVDEAIAALVERKILRWRNIRMQPKTDPVRALQLTAQGRKTVDEACQLGTTELRDQAKAPARPAPGNDLVVPGVVTGALRDAFAPQPPQGLARGGGWNIQYAVEPKGDSDFGESFDAADRAEPVMIELNLRYGVGAQPPIPVGIAAAIDRVKELWRLVGAAGEPTVVADQYMSGDLTESQLQNITAADSAGGDWPERAIFRIWPDFEMRRQIDVSCTTIKALPAQRSFAAFGDGIVWAVIDSGIDATHPHFLGDHTLDDSTVADLHHDFVSGSDDPAQALIDDDGHGTHVAGIIAGGLAKWPGTNGVPTAIGARKQMDSGALGSADPVISPRTIDVNTVAGVAPRAKLVSLRVLGGRGDLTTRTARVMTALAYVRQKNAESGKLPRIHGVNLSLGYDFLAEWFACGQSPLCLEVNKLVASGVIVVVAAGNSGYVKLNTKLSEVKNFSADITINDPGNAERAITVGSTHRDAPHTNGISYFSSRGPTGDGRQKPDLVAPGERITSAAAGNNLKAVQRAQFDGLDGAAVYIEDSGTSMAAPHVSGAVAAFLSVQQELIGQPDEVKRIFKSSATSLNRDPNFQGAGMVDLMRALQAQ